MKNRSGKLVWHMPHLRGAGPLVPQLRHVTGSDLVSGLATNTQVNDNQTVHRPTLRVFIRPPRAAVRTASLVSRKLQAILSAAIPHFTWASSTIVTEASFSLNSSFCLRQAVQTDFLGPDH